MKLLRHKYNSVKTEVEGRKFSSKKEAAEFCRLKKLKEDGKVHLILRQVPIDLLGGAIYRVDFLVFYTDGTAEFRECKGFKTPVGELKIKLAQDLHNISITVV